MLRRSPCWAYNFPFARVFVINLDRRPDRWQHISHQLLTVARLPAVHVERCSAVEGSNVASHSKVLYGFGLVSKLGVRRLQEPPTHRIWGMDLNPGAVGCALSHVRLWARIAAEGQYQGFPHKRIAAGGRREPVYFIVEDDAVFSSDFLRKYMEVSAHVPEDWQVLYVGGLDTAQQCPQMQVAEGVCRVPQFHRTTSAYVVTPAGARRLLTTCLPLTYQLDTAMTMHAAPGSEAPVPYIQDPLTYTLQPPLVAQAAQLGSDIQGDPPSSL